MFEQFPMGDELLEDVVAYRSFLYVSKIDKICNEVSIFVKLGGREVVVCDSKITVEEVAEDVCAKTVSESGTV